MFNRRFIYNIIDENWICKLQKKFTEIYIYIIARLTYYENFDKYFIGFISLLYKNQYLIYEFSLYFKMKKIIILFE